MDAKLCEMLRQLSDMLHFFGKYNESNVLAYLCQVVKINGWETTEDLQKYLERMREPL